MAYNREWDQGKDTWAANGQWDEGGSSGNVRERDDDYYGEGKRRKFNDGVRSARAGPRELSSNLVPKGIRCPGV